MRIDIDDKKFDEAKTRAKEQYEQIGKIRCPYLEDSVHFNNEGFEHLLFKTWNRTRSRNEQYARLKLLHLAPIIISKSHTLQEYDQRNILIRQKINSRWEKRFKLVKYYVFIAILKGVRLKIIVKEIEGAEKFFYSLYPFWKIANDDIKKKVFYSGDLEKD
jgi:hypothetical protein